MSSLTLQVGGILFFFLSLSLSIYRVYRARIRVLYVVLYVYIVLCCMTLTRMIEITRLQYTTIFDDNGTVLY